MEEGQGSNMVPAMGRNMSVTYRNGQLLRYICLNISMRNIPKDYRFQGNCQEVISFHPPCTDLNIIMPIFMPISYIMWMFDDFSHQHTTYLTQPMHVPWMPSGTCCSSASRRCWAFPSKLCCAWLGTKSSGTIVEPMVQAAKQNGDL